MAQADDKKSEPDALQSNKATFIESGLPDAQLTEHSADGGSIAFPVIGVGASAGGVEALQRLFKSLPPAQGIAYIIVVHLAPMQPSQLAGILAKSTSMTVMQAISDMAVEPNTVYIIPPNHYLTFDSGFLRLEQMPQPRPLSKPVDRLFISLAEDLQERAIGIVLTGADHDGTIGLKAIKEAGGMVMAQLPETAQHPSMPESAIHTGLVDYVLPIEEMGKAFIQYIEKSDLWQHELPATPTEVDEALTLKTVIMLLSTRGGGDFRGYKEGMLMRRTKRRMALQGLTSLDAYVSYLQETPSEVRALGTDFLIKVTEFFREPAAWQVLEQQVLPRIIEALAPGEPLRIWIVGCATGEEAYSMGITVLEFLKKGGLSIKLNIIGSDLDPASLEIARAGSYPESITNVLNPDLLARYFSRRGSGPFVVRKALRESVMFSQHNLLADPPFSHMSLVSCRNLLIYVKPEVQDKLIQMFHFALSPEGYLFLGKSETVGERSEIFTPVDKPHRLYRCLPTERKTPVKLPLVPDTSPTRLGPNLAAGQPRMAYAEMVRELLLRQRLATAVLIDRDSHVLYLYGPTRDFIWNPEGALTRDLLAMVSDEMRTALRAVIHSVRSEGKGGEIILPPVPGEDRQLRLRATKAGDEDNGLLLVTFEYEALGNEPGQAVADAESWAKRQLEDDLRTTRLDLETSIQALEASNVDLRIANEEAMSMNEELQSANEELETSKEEMQSVNEELGTVNSDLERTVNELRTANDDLSNLLASSDLPTLFLDRELRIKRFTPACRTIFSLIPSDIGRPIGDFASRLEPQDLITVARQVQSSRSVAEDEVHTPEGNYYLRRVLPYRIEEDRVEGVVVTFVPIDALRRGEQELRESEKRFRTLADTAPVFIWISGLGARFEFVNRRFADVAGRIAADLLDVGWHSLVHSGDLEAYLEACRNAEAARKGYDCELRLRMADGSYNWMRFVGEPRFERETLVGFVGSSTDIQYHKNAEEELRKADRRKDEFLAILGHELRNPLSPIRNAAQALQFVDSSDKRLLWARETITRQVDHMTRLVDDLLDIARLTRGMLTLRKETVDMSVVVHHAGESTQALMDERKHHLNVAFKDEPIFVNGDPVRLTQIIENLLTNAAKFTDERGKYIAGCSPRGTGVSDIRRGQWNWHTSTDAVENFRAFYAGRTCDPKIKQRPGYRSIPGVSARFPARRHNQGVEQRVRPGQ